MTDQPWSIEEIDRRLDELRQYRLEEAFGAFVEKCPHLRWIALQEGKGNTIDASSLSAEERDELRELLRTSGVSAGAASG